MPTPLYPICEAPQDFEEVTMDDETTALDMSSSVAPDPFSTDTYMSVEGDPFSPYAPSDNAPIAFGMAAVMVKPISQRVQQWLDVLGTDDEGDKPRPTTSQIRHVFAQIERALKDGDPFKEGELEELRLAVVDPHRGDAPNLNAPALALEEALQKTLLRTRAVNQLHAINYALRLRKYPDAYTLLTQIRPSEIALAWISTPVFSCMGTLLSCNRSRKHAGGTGACSTLGDPFSFPHARSADDPERRPGKF